MESATESTAGSGASITSYPVSVCRLARTVEPHGLLAGVHVERVERLLARAVEPLGGRVDPPAGGRVRHLLDADGDLQRVLLLRVGEAPPRGAQARIAPVPGAGRGRPMWYR